RDRNVTGVQTCALPISGARDIHLISFWGIWVLRSRGKISPRVFVRQTGIDGSSHSLHQTFAAAEFGRARWACERSRLRFLPKGRSEERRVGKEGRWWWV